MNMKMYEFNIYGGTAVRPTKKKYRITKTLGLVLLLWMTAVGSGYAQGSIFGTVTNSDLSTPANGEISFVGYLDDTDEEIRIETSDGAGYDNGNWFDDFQNYLTEAPGNPYDYHFFNTVNGEGFQLSSAIPNNSFQQENVALVPVVWPAAPGGLTVVTVSSSAVVVSWNGQAGLSYHVYRRLATSNGSFFRVDNPAGLLSDPGTLDSFYVDGTGDGVSSYDYLVIAEDVTGNLSPHSSVVTINSAVINAPVVSLIAPDSGTASGGIPVDIIGSGFDPAGVDVLFGATAVAATVVSPFHLTVTSPAGPVGVSVDISVVNTAAGQTSNVLTGAYTFSANAMPVLAAIGPQGTTEGVPLTFITSASDPDGEIPILSSSTLPGSATYVDSGDGSGYFNWTPLYTEAGTYGVTFYATDALDAGLVDSELVQITVNEAGNQPPVLAAIGSRSTTENINLNFIVTAGDPEGTFPILTASGLPGGATFADSGDGTGVFDWTPDFTQAGPYDVIFYATDDSAAVDSEVVTITVNDAGNQTPVLAFIGPQTATEDVNLNLSISASDPDGTIPALTADSLPSGATFADSGDGTGVFDWTPDFTQAGSYNVTFYATDDSSAVDSEVVLITVSEAGNQTPVLAFIGPQTATEDVNLNFAISASDPDGTIPALSADSLPFGATFADSGDGTGVFDWTPDFTQAGSYNVIFYATDALDAGLVDSELVQITVNEVGNQPPVLASVNDTSVAEGATLTLVISASDLDGEIPSLSTGSLPANATFDDSLNGTGYFNFNPDFTQAAVYDVVFKAIDAALAVDSIVVQITVTDVNQMPVLAGIGPQTGAEEVLLSFVVTATDPDGTIPAMSTSALPGTATFVDSLNGVGLFEWTPTFADSGTYTVTFYATDADYPADIDSEQVTVTITDAGNQAPVLAAIGAQAVAEGGNLSLVISATDVDGTLPSLRAENMPVNAGFVDSLNGTGVFDFSPDFTQSGVYSVIFIADDGALADTESVEITVTEAGNVAPTIDSLGDFVVNEGDSLGLTITATDPDGGAILPALSVSTTLNNYTFTDNGDGTGTLTYLPDFYDAGIDTVRFFATDFGIPQRTSASVSQITTVDINQPPVFDSIGPFAVAAGDTLIFVVSADDSTDPNTTHLVFLSTLGLPPNATFVDNGDGTGTFEFQPTLSQTGLISVSFLAVDQGVPQQSATLDVDITVVAENARPIIAPIDPQTVVEGNTLVINVSASDPDGPAPTIDTSDAPQNSTFVDNGDGTAVFTYTPDFIGGTRLTSVTFKVSDGIAVTKTNPVLIQVYDAGNQVPVFDSLPSPSVTEGQVLEQAFTAYDPDGFPVFLSVDEATLPNNASFVDSGNGVGVLTFAPDFTQSGLYDVDIIASDGPEDDPATLSDTMTVTVDVIEAGNQPPVLAPISDASTQEELPLVFTISASDPDGTFPALSSPNLPNNATLTDLGDGTADFEFSPDLTQADTYQIMFYASDGVETDSQEVTITVIDKNQLPFVFTSGGRTMFEGETLEYVVTSFDADGTIPLLTVSLSGEVDSLPPNMTFVDNRDGTGTLTFVPDYTQGGPVSNPSTYNLVFTATDEMYLGVAQSSPTVTIEVINRNQPPELFFPDGTGPFTATEGEQVIFNVAVIDVDAVVPPSLTALNMPDSNAVFSVVSSAGTFRFSPDFTQSGTYVVTFIAVDDSSAADTQAVQVDIIEAGNQKPSFTRTFTDTLLVPLDRLYEIFVEAIDLEVDSISLQASPILSIASWIDNGDGTGLYSFTPGSTFLDSAFRLTFVATDHPWLTTDTLIADLKVVKFLRGDLDNNKRYTMNDLASLLGYLFRYGPEPAVLETADVDGDGASNIGDITYLIRYMYFSGPPPPP